MVPGASRASPAVSAASTGRDGRLRRMPDSLAPPSAPARPVELTLHGDTRVDPWYWLRDRENPEVIEYLEAENAFTAAALDHTQAFQDRLFEEIRGRIQETDVSA